MFLLCSQVISKTPAKMIRIEAEIPVIAHDFPCRLPFLPTPLASRAKARHLTHIQKGNPMSDAIRIFSHAISMVFRDFGATLRATSVGVALVALSVVALIASAPASFGTLITQSFDTDAVIPNVGLVVAAFLLMAIGYLTMVAAWHRYVLLPQDQRSGGFTPSAGIVLGYLGRSILLGLLMMLLAIPVFIPVGIIAAATNSVLVSAIASIPAIAILIWVFLRLSLILPACTIHHDMKIRASWDATKDLSGTIAMLTIIMALADFLINQVLGLLPSASILGGVVSVVISVLYALVSASVLTTLYGIAVEGRDV